MTERRDEMSTSHPSYDPAAAGATRQDVDSAIDESIRETRIAHLSYTDARAELLAEECEDSVEQTTSDESWVEYWGEDIDGNEWRVHLAR